MAFDTYANLQTAILNRLDMAGDSEMVAAVPDFITIAETSMVDDRRMRVDWLVKRAYATPTEAFIAVPTDFKSLRDLQWDYSNYRLPLKQVSPDLIDKMVPSNTTGIPEFFCIQDRHFELRPAPATGNDTTVRITYYFAPDALSDSNTSNEFLVNVPDVLYYRSLVEAFRYINNEQAASTYERMYEEGMNRVKRDAWHAQWDGVALRTQADSYQTCF